MIEVMFAIFYLASTLAVLRESKITSDFYEISSMSLQYPRKKSFRTSDLNVHNLFHFPLKVMEEAKAKVGLGKHYTKSRLHGMILSLDYKP